MAWELWCAGLGGSRRVLGCALVAAVVAFACGHEEAEPADTSIVDGIVEAARATFVLRDSATTVPVLRPVLPATRSLAVVELAPRADGVTRVRDATSNLAIGFSLQDAGDAAVIRSTMHPGFAAYPAGGPEGAQLLQRVSPHGTEDFLWFERRPEREEVAYRIDVRDVSGLRLVENILELLDAMGTPRLRMAAPWILGKDGTFAAARVRLEGCAVDESPAAPWGRAITAPGAAECTVRVLWGAEVGARVTYPVLLDPAWTSTSETMTTTRTGHTATRLSDGRVLMVGGQHPSGASTVYLSTAELFDPGTNTFAATGSMTEGRSYHVAELLSGGRVLAAGGVVTGNGVTTSAEIYEVSGGSWVSTRPLATGRRRAAAAALGNGKVLVVGGISSTSAVLRTSEVFDPTGVGSWSAGGDMASVRHGHTLSILSSGRVLVAAGITTLSVSDLQQAEIYEPLTNAWSPTGTLGTARYYHAAAVLGSGQVLVAGGYSRGISANTPTAERFSTTTGTWSSAASLSQRRQHHTLTALPSGAALAVGGVTTSDGTQPSAYFSSAELYDPTRNSWSSAGSLLEARYWHTATLLLDGRVLVAGGQNALGPLASAELFDLDAAGTACTSAAGCKSGFCVDGFCCTSECSAPCYSCSAAATGGSNGTCAPVQAGTDPNDDCDDEGSPSCAKNGLCDGAGNCQNYPSTSCTPRPCTTGSECTSGRCYDGICCDSLCTSTCRACTAAKKGHGVDGICEPIADGSDPDGECASLGTGICAGDGVCNGSGQCRLPTTGSECAPASCLDDQTAAQASICGSSGTCPTQTTTNCAPYLCDTASNGCKPFCNADIDCVPGLNCVGGVCQSKPQGAACTTNGECATGNCADGVCCNRPCVGQCEACDLPGNVGTCAAVAGAPRNGRPACSGEVGTVCAGTCDGVTRNLCTYPDNSTACADATCAGDEETARRCDGAGVCGGTTTKPCIPYVCGTDTCKTSCESDADCTPGAAVCNAESQCVSSLSPFCADADTQKGPGDAVTECFPFPCRNDRCATTCLSNDDCAKGAFCFLQTQVCAVPQTKQDDGCGCRTVRSTQSSSAAALFTLFGLLLVRRRLTAAASAEHGDRRHAPRLT